MNLSNVATLEPKHFYRKLENVFANLETGGHPRIFGPRFAQEFEKQFSEHFPIHSIIAIDIFADDNEVLYRCGDLHVKREFLLHLRTVELPWVGIWEKHIAAVFSVNDENSVLVAVFLELSSDTDQSVFSAYMFSLFSSLHYSLNQHVKRLELQDAFEQARAIQMSLLPPGDLQFGPFEISASTIPAHSVGGDVYDFRDLSDGSLAIAIADASGHGLPAALQARDVIIGLRMGLELESDITKIVRKLNSIIHRSGLASRFASLLFGTLDASGVFHYVNAGHLRPLLLDSNGFRELDSSSMILGPCMDIMYRSGTAVLHPGSLLLLYTDGVLEHSNALGQEFGTQELKRWMLESRHKNVNASVKSLFAKLREFGEIPVFRDDATAILIRCN